MRTARNILRSAAVLISSVSARESKSACRMPDDHGLRQFRRANWMRRPLILPRAASQHLLAAILSDVPLPPHPIYRPCSLGELAEVRARSLFQFPVTDFDTDFGCNASALRFPF